VAVGGRRFALDEVDLLAAGVEPGAAEAEVGTVGPGGETEHVHVEAHRLLGLAHVDRDVMQRQWLHGLLSSPAGVACTTSTARSSLVSAKSRAASSTVVAMSGADRAPSLPSRETSRCSPNR